MAVGVADGAADDEPAGRHRGSGDAGGRPQPRPPATRCRRLLGPAEAAKALGVSEADVIASLEVGRPEGQEDRQRSGGSHGRRSKDFLELIASAVAREPTARREARRRPRAQKFALPGLRRRGALEPGASRRWSARSAAPRRRPTLRDPRRRNGHRRARSRRRRCASIPDSRARLAGATKISVRCQSCRAISVFDPARVGQRCDSAARPQLVPYEQVKDAFRPESLLPFAVAEPQARELLRAWYGASGSRRTTSTAARSPTRCTASTSPTGRSTRRRARRLDGRAGRYYYVEVNGKTRAARRVDAGRGLARSTPSTTNWCARRRRRRRRCSRQVEPFPTGSLDAVRPRLPRGLDRRALPDRPRGRGRRDRGSRWTHSCASLCARAGARRHAAQPAGRRPSYSRPDVQAHPGAGLAADLHLRQHGPTRSSVERRDRQGGRRSTVELDQDRPRRLSRPAGPLPGEPARGRTAAAGRLVSGRTCRASGRAR